MDKTKVSIGPIVLNVWNDYYGAPNRLSPTRPEASAIVAQEGASMITVPIAKAIFDQANLQLIGTPLGKGSQVEMRNKLDAHNKLINIRVGSNQGLIAGHMKDLVLSEKLNKDANIVIWGWCQNVKAKKFWQPEFGGHYAGWADYSQGLRLVDRTCFINNVAHDLLVLYKDPIYAKFLTISGQPLHLLTY